MEMAFLGETKKRVPDCIVFMMTGHRMEALRLGTSTFLEKPLDVQRLGTLLSPLSIMLA